MICWRCGFFGVKNFFFLLLCLATRPQRAQFFFGSICEMFVKVVVHTLSLMLQTLRAGAPPAR